MLYKIFTSKTFHLFVLFTLIAAAPAVRGQDHKNFIGTWEGALKAPNRDIGIIVTFKAGDGKDVKGTIDIPSQSVSAQPLGEIVLKGTSISFTIADFPVEVSFSGNLTENKKKIEGKFTQGDRPKIDFYLTKKDR